MAEVPVGASVLLLVTANRGVRRQVQNVVRETSYELVKTASVELARVYLEERRPLLVLLDFDLIGSADLCMQLSRAGVSVLGLTPDEAEAAAAFSAGVHDYLCYDHKNFSEALRWRIRHVLRGQPAPAPRLPENTRCLVWSALVRQHNTDFQWQVQVHDEENARLFMPLTLTPGQSYTDAWQQSKVVDDLDNTAQVFRNALQNGQKGYHQSFRVQNAKGIRWIFEDVNITPLGDGAWRLVGVCTDVTAYRQDETTLAENDRLRGDIQRLREALDTYKQNEATLQDNESRYLRLIEQASDGIAIMDEEGTLLEMNAQMCDLVGYSHDELKHMNLRDLLQPQGLFEEPIRLEQLAQDDTLVIERPLRRKNGSLVYVEINGRMIEDRHVQCILHDITDRRVAETDLSISQIALQTKTSSLTIINALADTLFRSLEMETVVESAVENIAPYINVDALNLYLYDIRENRLHLVAQRGMPETILRIGDTLPVDGSMTGIAIQTHEMVFSDDLQHDTRLDEQFRSGVMQAAFTTFYGLPVLYQDQVMGALALLFRDKRRLTPEEIETLFSVTRTLGVAVANASYVTKLKEESEQRLRAEAAEREQRLLAEALRDSAAALTSTLNMDEVLERVLEVLMRVLPCDATSIAMIDGNALRVVGARCQDNPALADYLRQLVIPADANNIRWMTEHKQPMFIEDTRTQPDWVAEWQRSYVGAPIIIDDEVIGFLSLDSAQVGSFNQSHVDRLQAFANQVSIAIRNTRYVAQIKAESEQRRRAEAAEREQRLLAETLRESAAFLNSTLYIDEVLEHVLAHVTRVVPCDAANVGLIEGDYVTIVTMRGYENWQFESYIKDLKLSILTTPTFSTMLRTKQPLVISRIEPEVNWVNAGQIEEWRHSYIGAPIVIDGEVIGFINLDSATAGTYEEVHVGRLQAFANQASIAVRNARLYEVLQQQASELELRVMDRTAEVESERAQLHAILDSMNEGVVFLDQEGKHAHYLNQALCQLTGYSMAEWQEDVVGVGIAVYGVGQEGYHSLRAEMAAALAQYNLWQGSMKFHHRDGTQFDVAITCNRVREPGGREVGTLMVIRDISQEKALEEQKSRFVARASHELRTPLTNLKTRLYLIPKQPQRVDEHMQVIRQVTHRMERLVDDLLDLSRLERGVLTLHCRDTVLQQLLHEVANTQRPEAELKRIELRIEMPADPLTISVDPERMTQVITNLVINAIKYTPEGGKVGIRLQKYEAKASQPARAVISIVDSGIGIASEHLPYLFQPFFRVDENTKGTGLGLSIARDIVELHQGRIEVESKPNVGTSFRVFLALADTNSSVQ